MKLFGYTIGAAVVASSNGQKNLYETAKGAGLNTLITAIDLAGLKGAVSTVSPLTVFAPSEAAFAEISGPVSYLTANSTYSNELLGRVLKTHVLTRNVTAAQVPTTATQVPTLLDGQNVTVLLNASKVTVDTGVNKAEVVSADVFASNGVAHVINKVLLPSKLPLKNVVQTALDVPFLSVLVAALGRNATTLAAVANAPLSGKALTVFAPTNAAFVSLLSTLGLNSLDAIPDALLAAVLKAHVVVGSDVVRAAGAKGLVNTLAGLINLDTKLKANTTDVETLNGVVHIVNEVIVPTLASYVTSQEDMKTLVSLVGQAGLLNAVSGPSTLTLFAPTDAAFAALPPKVVAHLTNKIPFNAKQLEDVLKYHILAGASSSTQLGASKTTLLTGEALSFSGTKINGKVNILAADLNDPVLGGYVHKIDGVLVPASVPVLTIAEVAVNSKLSTLVAALSALDLVNKFDLPTTNAWTVFAPTEAAFAKIQSTVEKALKDKALLQKILLAHVVDSAVFSKDLPAEITTLGGEKIKTSTLKINTKDIGAINGVVHLLDEVIIPPSLQTTAAPTTTTKAPSTSDSAVLSAALTIAATLAGALVF